MDLGLGVHPTTTTTSAPTEQMVEVNGSQVKLGTENQWLLLDIEEFGLVNIQGSCLI